jgi:hypothetical protein
MAYKGELGDYYCMAAKAAGRPCPDYKRMHEGFKYAYKDMAKNYPCFGFAAKMPNIVWWKTCVRDSFVRVRIFVKVIIVGKIYLHLRRTERIIFSLVLNLSSTSEFGFIVSYLNQAMN